MTPTKAFHLSLSGQRAPVDYDRAATYSGMIAEKDVLVPMRDGVKIAIDVYRPDTTEKLPALLAFSIHNKDLQGPELAEASLTHPAWSMLWTGPAEAGDTRFFVARGYVHVIGNPRGIGKSEAGGSRAFDSYDLIEWIAAQPWCDGNVGMVGISGFGAEQFMAAKLGPPHLKAIFPFDPRGAYGEAGGFRDEYPGGVIHLFRFLLQVYASAHQQKGQPKALAPEREKLWQEAIANPDFKMYPHVYNVLALKGQHFPVFFDILIDPYDKEAAVEKSEAEFSKITVPTYTGSGWYGYTYKTHLNGAQNWFCNLKAPHKKLLLAGPAHLDRPVKAFHNEMLRWYDQWLKGIDTGILNDPPVRFWVMGANEWRSASDWPPRETQWIKLYLRGWERLTTEPFTPSSADDYQAPDAFAQMPASQTKPHPEAALSERAALRRRHHRRAERASSLRRDRPRRHQLDRHSQGRRPGRGRADRARRRARRHAGPARTGAHARLAQGVPSRRRSEAIAARPAVASAHARGAQACRSRRDQRIRHRDHGDRQPVQARSPHLRRDHQPRRRDRRGQRRQCRVHPVSHLQQQDRAAPDLSRPQASIASLAADHCERLRCERQHCEEQPCPRSRFTTLTRWASRWVNIRRSRASRRPSSCSSRARWRPTVAARSSARTTSMRSADRSSPTSRPH